MISDMQDAFVELLDGDERAAAAIVRSLGVSDLRIQLIEDELTISEAVDYALTLSELGQRAAAEGVLLAVWSTIFGAQPQGSQHIPVA